jgi:hypothetical protein
VSAARQNAASTAAEVAVVVGVVAAPVAPARQAVPVEPRWRQVSLPGKVGMSASTAADLGRVSPKQSVAPVATAAVVRAVRC